MCHFHFIIIINHYHEISVQYFDAINIIIISWYQNVSTNLGTNFLLHCIGWSISCQGTLRNPSTLSIECFHHKYVLWFWQMYFATQRNTFIILNKYILDVEQIHLLFEQTHFVCWSNTFCILNKYLLCLEQILFITKTNNLSILNKYLLLGCIGYSISWQWSLPFALTHFIIYQQNYQRIVFTTSMIVTKKSNMFDKGTVNPW